MIRVSWRGDPRGDPYKRTAFDGPVHVIALKPRLGVALPRKLDRVGPRLDRKTGRNRWREYVLRCDLLRSGHRALLQLAAETLNVIRVGGAVFKLSVDPPRPIRVRDLLGRRIADRSKNVIMRSRPAPGKLDSLGRVLGFEIGGGGERRFNRELPQIGPVRYFVLRP